MADDSCFSPAARVEDGTPSSRFGPPDGGGRGAEIVAGHAWELSPQTPLLLLGRQGPYGDARGLFSRGTVAYFFGGGRGAQGGLGRNAKGIPSTCPARTYALIRSGGLDGLRRLFHIRYRS